MQISRDGSCELLPMDADVSDMGRAQGAVIGLAHPFDEDPAMFRAPGGYSGRICGGRGMGKVDYLEVGDSMTIDRRRRCGIDC